MRGSFDQPQSSFDRIRGSFDQTQNSFDQMPWSLDQTRNSFDQTVNLRYEHRQRRLRFNQLLCARSGPRPAADRCRLAGDAAQTARQSQAQENALNLVRSYISTCLYHKLLQIPLSLILPMTRPCNRPFSPRQLTACSVPLSLSRCRRHRPNEPISFCVSSMISRPS